jgi:hypothetical protein
VTPSPRNRLTIAWLVVVAVSLVYLVIDESAVEDGTARASTAASICVIALALVKLRIILREFMDVRHAPRALRSATDALVVVMGVSLLGTYLVGRAIS